MDLHKEKVEVAARWRVMAVKTRIRRLIKWQIFPAIEMRYDSLSFIKKFSPPALSGARDEQGPQLSKIIKMWRLEILGMDSCSKGITAQDT